MENNEVNTFRELLPEEREVIKHLYHENCQPTYVRIGPKGYFYMKDYSIEYAREILNMELKQGDVFVTSYQRSGTTLTQELVWLLVKNFDYDTAANVPLVLRYVFLELAALFHEHHKCYIEQFGTVNPEIVKVFEGMAVPATVKLSEVPSPRFVKTHLPVSLLPTKLLDTAKVVYVARDPRDVIVSNFHFARYTKSTKYEKSFRDFWNAFKNDLFILTPYFEHVKESWELRKHPNMLFLFYEDLLKDLPAAIHRVSTFLGQEVTAEQMERLCNHLSFDNFKTNKSVNHALHKQSEYFDNRETFIRKGGSGGWRQYFDAEMEQEAARWIADNLRGTDLTFPTISDAILS